MRKVLASIIFLAVLAASASAYARGGQAADDCPPGSADPDCVAAAKNGK